MNLVGLEEALGALGEVLADKGSKYEVVAIGGGSLLLLGQIERPTRDLDLVGFVEGGSLVGVRELPLPFLKAVESVGKALGLGNDWVNVGPASLVESGLPNGFEERMETRRFGSLTVHLASRFDQICFKLYAAVDQGPGSKHFADLLALSPEQAELQKAKKWCQTQDVSEGFAIELEAALEHVTA